MAGESKELIWRLDRDYAHDDHAAPGDARLAISEQRDLPSHIRDDLLIVVSELVANAIRHPPPVPGGVVTLTVRRETDAIHVEVRDPGGAFTAHEPTREGGYGLIAVDRISAEWGVNVADTTLVWCTIRIPE